MKFAPRIVRTTVATLLLLAAAAHGRTVTYPDAGCSIEIPDGWFADTVTTYRSENVERLLLIMSPDSAVALEMLLRYGSSNSRVVNDDFVAAWFSDLRSEGIEVHDSGSTSLGGARALRHGAIVPDSGGGGYERYTVVTIIKGIIYELTARSRSGHPETNPAIRRVIESFAFIDPQDLPGARREEPGAEEKSSQKRVEWMALGGLFVMVALLFTGFHLWRAWTRRRQRINDAKTWKSDEGGG